MKDNIFYIYGFGNPGRQDDGMGPAIADRIEGEKIAGVVTDSNYQLNIEDAHNISDSDVVVFVDASIDADEPFTFSRIMPAAEITFTTHTMSPESVLALCKDIYDRDIEAYVLAIKGYEWEFLEGFSPAASENFEKAYLFLRKKIEEILNEKKVISQKEDSMSDKKILIIDDDPDILESIKAILSSEKFAVVTASDGKEGIEKFSKEKPDLVLCDMMMERVDAGSKVAELIRKENKTVPVFLLSSIGNATASNINVSDLGFNGVLQKPVEPEALIADVKKTLGLK